MSSFINAEKSERVHQAGKHKVTAAANNGRLFWTIVSLEKIVSETRVPFTNTPLVLDPFGAFKLGIMSFQAGEYELSSWGIWAVQAGEYEPLSWGTWHWRLQGLQSLFVFSSLQIVSDALKGTFRRFLTQRPRWVFAVRYWLFLTKVDDPLVFTLPKCKRGSLLRCALVH